MSSFPTSRATAFYHASDLPAEFWDTLRQNEQAANTILPFAINAQDFPRDDHKYELWIIVYDNTRKNVEFILSCTEGELGNYPIFVYTPKSSAELAQEEDRMTNALLQLVLCLLSNVSPQRIFSVFSLATVAEKFAEIFEEHTSLEHGIRALKDPYYDATLTFCTKETFKKPSDSIFAISESEDCIITLRRADMSNLEGITALCKRFSSSPPYILDDEHAKLEAIALITHRQVWVHMIKRGDEEWETACLVATTRKSDNVTAVTKVYTAEKWRRHSCAARLLHRVCRDIIQENKIVVLYVGNSSELASARRLYHKVGFQGLDTQQAQKVENVEQWLEIGFEGTTLGYW